MALDDNEIIRQCLDGQTHIFSDLVAKYEKPIFNAAYRIIHDFDDAEDIAQNVFVKAYENLREFNSRYKFFSWIYRMAINESINLINKKKKNEILDSRIKSKGKSTEEIIDNLELGERVQKALNKLDINYRIVVVLKHFLEFSYKEISDILEIPEKTVKSRLYSARQILKDIIIQNKVN